MIVLGVEDRPLDVVAREAGDRLERLPPRDGRHLDAIVAEVARGQPRVEVAQCCAADMLGVGLILDEAMVVREQVGRVSDVTWSKVQGSGFTIARTQAYALRQLDAIASKLERARDVPALAETAQTAERDIEEWLAVIARCFQLGDALAVLELDRVLDAEPDEIDRHRVSLGLAASKRRDVIASTTGALLRRMDEAADRANAKVLRHPMAAPVVVRSSVAASDSVVLFRERLSIDAEGDDRVPDARRWRDAAVDVKDSAVGLGMAGADAAARAGTDVAHRGRVTAARLADSIVKRLSREGDKPADTD